MNLDGAKYGTQNASITGRNVRHRMSEGFVGAYRCRKIAMSTSVNVHMHTAHLVCPFGLSFTKQRRRPTWCPASIRAMLDMA